MSQHPLSQKKGTIMSMVDRAFLLSHPRFHFKNFNLIINTLLENDYPLNFIFENINNRLRSLLNKRTPKQDDSMRSKKDTEPPWFTIPYVYSISDKFKNVTRDMDVRLSFFSLNKLNRVIRVHKDSLPTSSKKNVVYKIDCNDCDASYVGQTKRQLKTRIAERKQHINRRTTTPSVITEHRRNYSHDFDWENVKILDNERFYSKRLISEMAHITLQKNGINLQTDTEFLHHAYIPIFKSV